MALVAQLNREDSFFDGEINLLLRNEVISATFIVGRKVDLLVRQTYVPVKILTENGGNKICIKSAIKKQSICKKWLVYLQFFALYLVVVCLFLDLNTKKSVGGRKTATVEVKKVFAEKKPEAREIQGSHQNVIPHFRQKPGHTGFCFCSGSQVYFAFS